jgi:hypothetical protein
MPILIPLPAPSAPYSTVSTVLDLTRARVNDAIATAGGEILTNTAPFTQTFMNGAWRRFQAYLANLGFSRFRTRTILTNFPVVGTQDPSSQTFLNWSEYFDGVSYYIPNDVSVLPQDFILPLKIGERQTGSNQKFRHMQMHLDGLPNERKCPWNQFWDWRDDKIFMPGSLANMDFEIEYSRYLTDFITVGEIQWYQQPVPIMRCESSLSNYTAYEFTKSRVDVDAAVFMADAKADAMYLFNNEVGMKQRTNPSRRAYNGRKSGGGYNGAFGTY